MRRLFALTSILLLTGCVSTNSNGYNDLGSTTSAGSVPFLSKLAGLTEPQLIAGMGRSPDSIDQADPQSRILKWRYGGAVDPAQPPKYVAAGGTWVAVQGAKAAQTQPGCVIEWNVVNNVALTYQSHGINCPT